MATVANESTFGERLAELRSKAELTKYALAKLSGVSQQTISQLESGAGDPSWDTVKRLARALGVPISDFDTGDDPREDDDSQKPTEEPAPKPKRRKR